MIWTDLIDRVFCFVLGHSWVETEPHGKGVYRCPLCNSRVTDVQLVADRVKSARTLQEKYGLLLLARELEPPKRRWAS